MGKTMHPLIFKKCDPSWGRGFHSDGNEGGLGKVSKKGDAHIDGWEVKRTLKNRLSGGCEIHQKIS